MSKLYHKSNKGIFAELKAKSPSPESTFDVGFLDDLLLRLDDQLLRLKRIRKERMDIQSFLERTKAVSKRNEIK